MLRGARKWPRPGCRQPARRCSSRLRLRAARSEPELDNLIHVCVSYPDGRPAACTRHRGRAGQDALTRLETGADGRGQLRYRPPDEAQCVLLMITARDAQGRTRTQQVELPVQAGDTHSCCGPSASAIGRARRCTWISFCRNKKKRPPPRCLSGRPPRGANGRRLCRVDGRCARGRRPTGDRRADLDVPLADEWSDAAHAPRLRPAGRWHAGR